MNSRRVRRYRKNGADRYCSPACGCDCRRSAYLKAKVAASVLAKELGKGWRPVVRENMGWHFYAVHKSGATMHQHGLRSAWCQIKVDGIQVHFTEPTPERARNAVVEALAGLGISMTAAAKELGV